MEQSPTSGRRKAYLVGLTYGLAAGIVGIAQWVLMARDLTERLAQPLPLEQRFPVPIYDETNVVIGNEWFWADTTAIAVGIMLVLCFLAAVTAVWISPRRQDGVIAAWVAAIVGSVMYAVATFVAVAISPQPDMTGSVVPCEPVFGIALFVALFPVGSIGAWVGVRVHTRVSGRRST
jgi:hypothetical protein